MTGPRDQLETGDQKETARYRRLPPRTVRGAALVVVAVALVALSLPAWHGRIAGMGWWIAVVVLARSLPTPRWFTQRAAVPTGYPWGAIAGVAALSIEQALPVLVGAGVTIWVAGVRPVGTDDGRVHAAHEVLVVALGLAAAGLADLLLGVPEGVGLELFLRVVVGLAVGGFGLVVVHSGVLAAVRKAPAAAWFSGIATATATGVIIPSFGWMLAIYHIPGLPGVARGVLSLLLVTSAGWVCREIGLIELRRLEAERALERLLSSRELEIQRLAKRLHSSTTQQLAAAQWRLSRGQLDLAAEAVSEARESLLMLQQQVIPGREALLFEGLEWMQSRWGVGLTVSDDESVAVAPDPAARRLLWYLLDVALRRPGAPDLDLTACHIHVSIEGDGQAVRLEVSTPALHGPELPLETADAFAHLRDAGRILGARFGACLDVDGRDLLSLEVPLRRSVATVQLADRRRSGR